MAKEWSAKLLIATIMFFVVLILTLTYGQELATEFGVPFGNTTNDVDINSTFGSQATCDYPRYRYNTLGESSRYFFDLDNLECEVSAGAIGQRTCNAINGCTWSNVTSGFLWFRDTSEQCTGTINKTFYNDGVSTETNICLIDGLQGANNIKECVKVGCTSYEPKENFSGGVSSPLTILDTVGDLFTFKYDFGIENDLLAFIVEFCLSWLILIIILTCIYLLSPFSN